MSSISGKNNYNSGFVPTAVRGCALWLDATDVTTMSLTGTNVTQWRDKSGNLRHANQFCNAPTYSSVKNSIDFTAAQGLNTTLISPSAVGTSIENAFFVITFSNVGTAVRNTIFGARGASGRLYDASSTFLQMRLDSTTAPAYSVNANLTTGKKYICYFQYDTTQQISLFNNPPIASGTVNPTFTSRTSTIGLANGGAGGLTGSIHEIIVYSNTLTQSDKFAVGGYLANKWGLLSDLLTVHPFKQYPPFTRAFTPMDVCSCALWLDSTDISGTGINPAINAGIPVWFDKSGNGRNLSQATASNRPTFTESGVAFNGTTSFLATATNPNIRPTIVYAVVTPNVIDVNRTVVKIGTSGGINAEYHVRFQSTSIASVYWDTSGITATPSLGNPVAERQLLTNTWDGTTAALYRNGGTDVSSLPLSGTQFVGTHILSVGSRNATATELFSGTMQEIILYNRAPTLSEQQQIEGYLANKWGLQSKLPDTHLFKLYPPLTPAFTPPQVERCMLWLDAADSNMLTFSGSNIATWLDKSGNANNSVPQGGSFTTPTRTVAGINGLDVVQFSSDLQLINTYDLFSDRSFAIYSVIRRTAGVTSGIVTAWLCGRTSNTNTNCVCGFNGNSIIKFGFASNELNVAFPTYSPTAEPPYLLGFYYTPGTRQIWNNGTLIGSDTNSTNIISVSNMQFGRFFNTYWRGQLGEVLVYNGVLTTPERQEIEGYLAAKWGLTGSLPNNHPYKKFRP